MDLYEVFSSPFTLYKANDYDHPCKCLKVKFKTKDIEGSTTAEEVFILSKKHLDDIVTQSKTIILVMFKLKKVLIDFTLVW